MTDADLSSPPLAARVALVSGATRYLESRAQSADPTRGEPAARAGDTSGIAELYRRYAPNILRRARAILGDAEEARDAVHEVFMKVISMNAERATITGPRDPTNGDVPCDGDHSKMTWLYRVTTNHCIDVLRVRNRRGALLSEHGHVVAPRAPGGDDDARLTLTRVLERVPDELKEVAIHFYVDEMTQDEIAAHLGCARRTVGYRLTRFRELATGICRDHLAEIRA